MFLLFPLPLFLVLLFLILSIGSVHLNYILLFFHFCFQLHIWLGFQQFLHIHLDYILLSFLLIHFVLHPGFVFSLDSVLHSGFVFLFHFAPYFDLYSRFLLVFLLDLKLHSDFQFCSQLLLQ